jgi:hypothetical protein
MPVTGIYPTRKPPHTAILQVPSTLLYAVLCIDAVCADIRHVQYHASSLADRASVMTCVYHACVINCAA